MTKRRKYFDKYMQVQWNVNVNETFKGLVALRLNHKEVYYPFSNAKKDHLCKDLRCRIPYRTFIDEEDLLKVLEHSELWYYDPDSKYVRATIKTTYLHRLIMGVLEDEENDVHHLDNNPFLNSKKNLLVLTKDQHKYLHRIIRSIKKKGGFTKEMLALELGVNVIAKMKEKTFEGYEASLIDFANSLNAKV